MKTLRWVLVATIVTGTAVPLAAQTAENSAERTVERLIEQLDSPRFSERARATTQLQRMGSAAIEPLEKVVLQGTSEAAQRAFEILTRNFHSDRGRLSKSARAALEQIAQTKNHPFAARAQQVLSPPEPGPPTQRRPINPGLLPVNPPLQRQIQVQVQIKSVHGQKEVAINENGREFKFSEDDSGITVRRPDGKGGVKRDHYQDKNQLKEKDREAYDKYQRYAGQGNRIRIQMGGPFRRGFRGLQLQPPAIPQIRRPQPRFQPRIIPQPQPKPKLDNTIEV